MRVLVYVVLGDEWILSLDAFGSGLSISRIAYLIVVTLKFRVFNRYFLSYVSG